MKEGWERKKLKDICSFQNGYAFKSNQYAKTGFPIVRITNIQSDTIIEDGIVFLDISFYNPVLDKYIVNKNDLLIAMSGATTGKVGINTLDKKFLLNQRVGKFIPNKYLDKKFLFYYLKTKTEDNLSISAGAAQPNLSTEQINNFTIPLPSISKQKRIVKILDKTFEELDKANANAEKNLKNAKELFESYLNDIFENKGDDWVEKRLGEVCEKFEYGTSKKSEKRGRIPVIRMGNIKNGEIIWDNLVYSNNSIDNKKYLLEQNDVLFNRTNSIELVGKSAIYTSDIHAIFAGYIIRIKCNLNVIDPKYLNIILNSKKILEYGRMVATSSVNQANISGQKLKNYKIVLPPLKEQKQIIRILYQLKEDINKLNDIQIKEIELIMKLKSEILNNTFKD